MAPSAMYFPTKPQLFTFKRRSPPNPIQEPIPNGAATDTNKISANGHAAVPDSGASSTTDSNDPVLGGTELISVQTVLETRVPSVFTGFSPSWWLPSGHLQTGYVVAGNFSKVDAIMYERTIIRLPDGGTLGIDMAPSSKEATDLPANTPIVVVQHGLTGGSYEHYVRSILAGAIAPKSAGGLGMRGFVVNFRGCAGVPFTSPQIYSARNTDDLRSGLLFITSKFPNAPIIGVGFSLGANIITRYLGEEGSNSKLRAGLALACPWDLKKNSDRLEGDFVGKRIYSRAMGENLHAVFKSHVEEWRALPPDDRMTPLIPKALALTRPTLKDIDHHIISQVGGREPPFPFESADAYYIEASSHRSLANICVPFLAINAADDPIVAHSPAEEATKSASCALVVTPHGGHLGWFQGGNPIGSGPPPSRWIRSPAFEWLRACAEDYVPDNELLPSNEDGRDIRDDGYEVDKTKKVVGFKVVEQGIMVDGTKPAGPITAGGLQGL